MSSPSRYRGSPPLRDPLLDLFNVYTHPVYSELGMSITEFREMIFDFICIRDGTLRPSNAEAALRLANTLAEFVPRGDYLNHAGFIDYFRRIWPILMARLPSELGERPLPSPVEDATLVDQIRELRHAAPSPPGMRRQYSHQGRPSRLDGPTKSPRVEGPREPHKHDDSASLRGEDMDGLKARLERRGLVLKDVDGDGNCYWYALSAQLPECGFDKRNFYHARKRAAFHISEEYLRRVTARLAERGLGSDDTLEVMKSAFTVRPRSLASYLDYLQTTREGGDNADLVAHIFGVSGNYPALLRYLADSDYRPIDEDTARQWFGLHVLTPPAPDGNGTIAAYVRELQFECLNNFEWIDSFYIQQTLADVFDAQITIWSVQAAEPTEFYPLEGSFRTPTRAVLARSQRHFHIVRDMRDMTQEERQALHIGGGRSSRVEMERPEELPLEYDLHYCADAPGIQHLGPLVRYWRAFPDSDARGDALNFWGHDRYHLGRSPLIVAIEAGNVEGVQLLVDTPEVDVNQADSVRGASLDFQHHILLIAHTTCAHHPPRSPTHNTKKQSGGQDAPRVRRRRGQPAHSNPAPAPPSHRQPRRRPSPRRDEGAARLPGHGGLEERCVGADPPTPRERRGASAAARCRQSGLLCGRARRRHCPHVDALARARGNAAEGLENERERTQLLFNCLTTFFYTPSTNRPAPSLRALSTGATPRRKTRPLCTSP